MPPVPETHDWINVETATTLLKAAGYHIELTHSHVLVRVHSWSRPTRMSIKRGLVSKRTTHRIIKHAKEAGRTGSLGAMSLFIEVLDRCLEAERDAATAQAELIGICGHTRRAEVQRRIDAATERRNRHRESLIASYREEL